MKYEYQKTCPNGHPYLIEVNRREAAFLLNLEEIRLMPCPICGNTDFSSLTFPHYTMDRQLLEEWAHTEEYYFMEQDEDIWLAQESNLEILLEVLDLPSTLAIKKKVLLGTLCVLIFDHLEGSRKNTDLIKRVSRELEKRKPDLLEAQDWIMPYIKQRVFPVLGMAC